VLALLMMLTACNGEGDLLLDSAAPPPAKPTALAKVLPTVTSARAPNVPGDYTGLVKALQDAETRDAATTELASRGDEAVPVLSKVALTHPDLPTRGWAIRALGQIDGDVAARTLEKIQYAEVPQIVQAWAGAARIQRADKLYELLALADAVVAMPALERPMEIRILALADQLEDVSQALQTMATGTSAVQDALLPAVLARGPAPLVEAMLNHPNDQARRLAAGLLGTLDGQNPGIGAVVAAAYMPDPKATEVLWSGGALYVPALNWKKADAQALVGHLISWQVFCEERGLSQQINQIRNNLNSLQLLGPAGFNRRNAWPESETTALVRQWGQLHGQPALMAVLKPWDLQDSAKYSPKNNGGNR
jgi:hypothetical protein